MKRWYLCPIATLDQLVRLSRQHHAAHLTSTIALVGVEWPGPAEAAIFEALPQVNPIPHVFSGAIVPAAAATALTSFGVLSTDTIFAAMQKVINATGMKQVALGEF
jgi:hypothetical protein